MCAVAVLNMETPGVTAVQLRLQPGHVLILLSELNVRLTMLLLLRMGTGRKEPIILSPTNMLPLKWEPQLFSIKVVPSSSMIVRWSEQVVKNSSEN